MAGRGRSTSGSQRKGRLFKDNQAVHLEVAAFVQLKVHLSSFGLFFGLLRPREISERLVLSEFYARIKSYVNSVCVDSRIGARSNEEQTIQNLNAKIESL